MVLSRHPANRKKFFIPAVPKDIYHSRHLKILGIDIAHDLNWKFFLLDGKMSIYKQLVKRVNALKILKPSTSTGSSQKHR